VKVIKCNVKAKHTENGKPEPSAITLHEEEQAFPCVPNVATEKESLNAPLSTMKEFTAETPLQYVETAETT